MHLTELPAESAVASSIENLNKEYVIIVATQRSNDALIAATFVSDTGEIANNPAIALAGRRDCARLRRINGRQ